jgi:MFS family permease
MLIAGRAIQGAGGGGLVTLVDVIIADLFSVRTRGMYLGIVSGVWAIASALGPVVGGALTQGASWRWYVRESIVS